MDLNWILYAGIVLSLVSFAFFRELLTYAVPVTGLGLIISYAGNKV